MTTYQGHKDWEHWNVVLWLGNDERLYRLAQTYYAKGNIAGLVRNALPRKTPDGACYTVENVTAACRFLFDDA